MTCGQDYPSHRKSHGHAGPGLPHYHHYSIYITSVGEGSARELGKSGDPIRNLAPVRRMSVGDMQSFFSTFNSGSGTKERFVLV